MNNFITTTAAAALMLANAPAMAAWEPTKPVEIVVAAGAGGASDQMARMIQAAIQKNNLMKQPMVVSLKGGASGAEALMYMKSSDGDANKLLIAYSLIYMLPLSAKIPFNWRELTPVAVMAFDQFVLWDNTTLPYKNVKEFVAAAKARQSAVQDGRHRLQARGPHPHRVHGKEDRRQVRLSAVQVGRRGGDPAGRQSHRSRTSTIRRRTSKSGAPARCGRCASSTTSASPTRAKVTDKQSWNDIPTCKEEGLDVQYPMLRAIFLPGKVTPEQTAFYVDLFKKPGQTAGIQGLHGEAGAQARVPHRQGHAQVPRGGRQAQHQPDDRSRLRREIIRMPL